MLTPYFTIQIEGEPLRNSLARHVRSFAFEDAESELDLIELVITDPELILTDHDLFQEGNSIQAAFGYFDNLTNPKACIIKDVTYSFPEQGMPTITVRAYDRGFQLAGKQTQRVWTKPAPGITYSEIAETIAAENQLKAEVEPTAVHHLRVVQSNQSDALFLMQLAKTARSETGQGVAGYVFYIEGDTLHFHRPRHDSSPAFELGYRNSRDGVLKSFNATVLAQGAKGAGTEAKSIGIDPRKKVVVDQRANNQTTVERPILGERTYLVDGNTGETRFKPTESGTISPTFDRSEFFHSEPSREPAADAAESSFQQGEFLQVTATATTVGIPGLKAKQNLLITGIGRKLSGLYYCRSVRHRIDESGYSCELNLKKNALGPAAGKESEASKGKPVDDRPPVIDPFEPAVTQVDAESGHTTGGPA